MPPPGHLAVVGVNEAAAPEGDTARLLRGSSGIQRALHVVVMGLGVGVRWASTQAPDTRLPRRRRAWRARFSRTEPHPRGATLLCRAAPGRAGVRTPHPRRGTGIGQEALLPPAAGPAVGNGESQTCARQIRADGQRFGEDQTGQRRARWQDAELGAR